MWGPQLGIMAMLGGEPVQAVSAVDGQDVEEPLVI